MKVKLWEVSYLAEMQSEADALLSLARCPLISTMQYEEFFLSVSIWPEEYNLESEKSFVILQKEDPERILTIGAYTGDIYLFESSELDFLIYHFPPQPGYEWYRAPERYRAYFFVPEGMNFTNKQMKFLASTQLIDRCEYTFSVPYISEFSLSRLPRKI